MYKRLRRRLTFVCTAGTVMVLAAMAGMSLAFSWRQLESQYDAGFASSVNSVLFYLQGTLTVDHTWLAQTEADGDLLVRIEYDGATLEYTGQNDERALVTVAALAQAQQLYPALWQQGAFGLGTVTELYRFERTGQEYRAAACLLPRQQGVYNVIIAQSCAGQRAIQRELLLFYSIGTLAAALLLGAFAWLFSGRAVKPATDAEQKQKEFLSAASHELRSPLAVIRLSAGSIKTLPAQSAQLADKIERECARMSTLVGDLLLLAGGAAGMRIQKVPVSPQTILLTTCERFEEMAAEKGICLSPDIGTVKAVKEKANWDVQRIEQALAVLVDNAVSYTPAGGKITVSLAVHAGTAQFNVEDSGPGIPQEEQEHVFERFYRADVSRSKKEHYGLGLSVAREIARLHGGKLTVGESQSLGGAAFRLRLPLTVGD